MRTAREGPFNWPDDHRPAADGVSCRAGAWKCSGRI